MRFLFLILGSLSLAACSSAFTQKPAPYDHYGAEAGAGAGSAGVHTVSTGDTLWSVANRYRLAMPDVVYLNNLRPPYALNVGQRISLPPPNEYKVQAGDTLYGISKMFDVSVTGIARQNRMSSPYTIHKGDVLRLPSVRPYNGTNVAHTEGGQVQTAAAAQTKAVTPVSRKPKYTPHKVQKAPPKRAGQSFSWPSDGSIISSYGPKKDGLHNDGINIKAPRGAAVRAAENGVVVYAGDELKGYGNLVLVKHADRWMTAYAHLDKITVARGATMARGQTLGTVGTTGGVDTPQLHFEVRRGTRALNPAYYLAQRGS